MPGVKQRVEGVTELCEVEKDIKQLFSVVTFSTKHYSPEEQ